MQLPAEASSGIVRRRWWGQARALQPVATPQAETVEPGGAPERLRLPAGFEPGIVSFVVPVQSVFIGVDAIRRGFARRRPEQQLLGNPGEGPVSQAGVGSEQKVPGMQQRISRGCRRGWGPRQGRLQLLTPVAIGSRAEAIGQALAFDGDSAGEALLTLGNPEQLALCLQVRRSWSTPLSSEGGSTLRPTTLRHIGSAGAVPLWFDSPRSPSDSRVRA